VNLAILFSKAVNKVRSNLICHLRINFHKKNFQFLSINIILCINIRSWRSCHQFVNLVFVETQWWTWKFLSIFHPLVVSILFRITGILSMCKWVIFFPEMNGGFFISLFSNFVHIFITSMFLWWCVKYWFTLRFDPVRFLVCLISHLNHKLWICIKFIGVRPWSIRRIWWFRILVSFHIL